jgi:hypothetical protein
VEVLLQGTTRTLWIDAICVNQSSVEEKYYQIPVIGKIYSQAQGVMIWQGEEDENGDLGEDNLRRFGDGINKAKVACQQELLTARLHAPLESPLKSRL